MTAVVIVIAVAAGFMAYTQSPSYRAKQQLELGEKYLEDVDYEQAIASFKLTLEIDPGNTEVIATVAGHMDEFYQMAREYGRKEEYAAEKEIALFMLTVDSGSVQGKIADAEADCGNGEFIRYDFVTY